MHKPKQKSTEQEKLLGVDYGDVNVGLAFGINNLVSPLKVIDGRNSQQAVSEIARLIIENKVDKIVLGLPLNPDGKETDQSRQVRKFGKLLKIKTKKPLHYVNEFRTSQDSVTEAINLGVSKKRRQIVDHLSAALILKEYYSRF